MNRTLAALVASIAVHAAACGAFILTWRAPSATESVVPAPASAAVAPKQELLYVALAPSDRSDAARRAREAEIGSTANEKDAPSGSVRASGADGAPNGRDRDITGGPTASTDAARRERDAELRPISNEKEARADASRAPIERTRAGEVPPADEHATTVVRAVPPQPARVIQAAADREADPKTILASGGRDVRAAQGADLVADPNARADLGSDNAGTPRAAVPSSERDAATRSPSVDSTEAITSSHGNGSLAAASAGGPVDGAGSAGAPGGAEGTGAVPVDLEALHSRLESAARGCYPAAAKKFRLTGTVPVHVCVNETGGLRGVELRGSSGSGLLDRAARDCVVPGAVPLPARDTCFDVPIAFR